MNDFLKQVDDFHLRFCNGFWSPCIVEEPFGKMLICYPEAQSLLWHADLENTHWTNDEIINAVETTAKRYFGEQGFQFSESWRGDVTAFKKTIAKRGYQKNLSMDWYRKELGAAHKRDEGIVAVETEAHKKDFLTLFATIFIAGDVSIQRLAYQLERPMNAVHNAYFVYYKDKQAVGIAACAWEDELGYYHSLAVDSEYQQQSIAKALVEYCLSFMKEAGVRTVVTAVEKGNAPSEKTQKALGFECFSTREIWSKAD
jgi:ribosomal protein S18 acetylase RimI-like enzyme